MNGENITLTAEETTPAGEGAQSETQDSELQERPAPEINTEGNEDRENGEETAEGSEGSGNPDFKLPVKFYGEQRNLTFEEAVEFAQKGMKSDKLKAELDDYKKSKPLLDKLAYLSSKHGKTAEEIIEGLMTADEQFLRSQLTEKYGELPEEVMTTLIKEEKAKAQNAYNEHLSEEKAQQAENEKAMQTRIADEFLELQKEFPEISSFDNVPDSVIIDAVNNGRNLVDAYLRHQSKESRKIEAAQQAEASAKKSSAGSLEGGEVSHATNAETAFLDGLWR